MYLNHSFVLPQSISTSWDEKEGPGWHQEQIQSMLCTCTTALWLSFVEGFSSSTDLISCCFFKTLLANLSWQGRQRSQISFEVKRIVTSKTGQRMGLDWEMTSYLNVLRDMKTSGLQLECMKEGVCSLSQVKQVEHPKKYKRTSSKLLVHVFCKPCWGDSRSLCWD